MADTSAIKQIVEAIDNSSNILVTVNSNPSVDELSAALGITLLINKLNKHATAVFSGEVPPAIEFLNPAKTFENTVDSLRDFIIALDKEKADHLRYKVDGDMVKIFITPYRTTINEKDLDFSQGDYNVETVIAIGVQNSDDLDRALASHGRILHDATVAAISLGEPTKLGGIEWANGNASSYSEMLYTLADSLKSDKKLINEQIANAFLTGIVAATDRFSNAKTTSTVMTIAAQLMSAGANQQLIATKLQEEREISAPAPVNPEEGDLKEGEAASIDKTEDKTPVEKSKDDEGDGSIGALAISHEPQGDLEEVAKQVSEKESKAATERAEDALAEHTSLVAKQEQADATKEAEEQLAEELAAVVPAAATVPSVADLKKDLEKASADIDGAIEDGSQNTMPVAPSLPPVVTPDRPSVRVEEQVTDEPSLGGTLNATTEQAAEDSRRAIEDDRNRKILSHGGSTYASDTPSFQAPLNSTIAGVDAEPAVHDVFGGSSQPTARVDTIQPPTPVAPVPTLEQIDSQNRDTDARNDALNAVNAAFEAPTTQPQVTSTELPPLPLLPPMPDFSTLPPLPGAPEPATSSVVDPVADTLGAALPPAPAAPAAAQPFDPAQFKIPGQS